MCVKNNSCKTTSKWWILFPLQHKILFFISLHRAFWYSHSSFTNRCTFIKTLIKIYIEVKWLLHVSVYDHHQGDCNWAWLKLYWWYENIQYGYVVNCYAVVWQHVPVWHVYCAEHSTQHTVHMFHILSSLVYPLTLLRKRISAASRWVISRFVVSHVYI